MKTLNLIKYNMYQLLSMKKLVTLFIIVLLIILHKIFQYHDLNKFISVFGTPISILSSDVLSTILFNFAPLIIIKDNFIDNYENKINLTLIKINNLNSWIIGVLFSYLIAIIIYFLIAYIITILINQNSCDLLTNNQLISTLITRYNINRIIFNLILLNILISYIYILNFIYMYMLYKNAGIASVINLCIMFLSYIISIKSPNVALYLPTTQGIAKIYTISNYCFSSSYVIIFITIVIFLVIIFSSKKHYLQ